MASDEERQRLVLMWRPGEQLVEEEAGAGDSDRGDAEREPVRSTQARTTAPSRAPIRVVSTVSLIEFRRLSPLPFAAMPIYEYRCPDGHVFELFQRMTDPPRSGARCAARAPSRGAKPGLGHSGLGFIPTTAAAAREERRRGEGRPGDSSLGQEVRDRHEKGRGHRPGNRSRARRCGRPCWSMPLEPSSPLRSQGSSRGHGRASLSGQGGERLAQARLPARSERGSVGTWRSRSSQPRSAARSRSGTARPRCPTVQPAPKVVPGRGRCGAD